jgi:prefoldin subunit 5
MLLNLLNTLMTQFKSIPQIKEHYSKKTDLIFEEYGIFFAFSDKQFEERKQNEAITSLGCGMFVPTKNADKAIKALQARTEEYNTLLASPEWRVKYIKYELSNHEAYYTGDIEDTLDALGSGFTYEEVLAVFKY